MIHLRRRLGAVRDLWGRAGVSAVLGRALHQTVGKVTRYERFDVIVLPREALKPIRTKAGAELSSRVATEDDLTRMLSDGSWGITPEKIGWLGAGYVCLISEVDEQIAGYTWAHSQSHAHLVDGLSITVPDGLVYNFDGFTHRSFRGFGLQSFRHHAVLGQPQWESKSGLLGYVAGTNYSSKKGQSKSGYRSIGSIRMIGTGNGLRAHLSRGLRERGIARV